ncbi:MAG TPA: hypothetical protein VLM20_07580 [Methylophilaceae bacterium]|nr:hypothetical protein [Methylophilaceae bacterium]
MKKILLFVLSLVLIPSFANADKPHGPKATEVKVSVGTKDGQMKFVPSNLTFERGNYYKLVITNPSSEDHYFTSDALSTHVFTRKVEVMDKAGNTLAEIHGAIHDMELKPDVSVAWYFFPMTKGNEIKLYCHKKGHQEHGMVGTIDIVGDLK